MVQTSMADFHWRRSFTEAAPLARSAPLGPLRPRAAQSFGAREYCDAISPRSPRTAFIMLSPTAVLARGGGSPFHNDFLGVGSRLVDTAPRDMFRRPTTSTIAAGSQEVSQVEPMIFSPNNYSCLGATGGGGIGGKFVVVLSKRVCRGLLCSDALYAHTLSCLSGADDAEATHGRHLAKTVCVCVSLSLHLTQDLKLMHKPIFVVLSVQFAPHSPRISPCSLSARLRTRHKHLLQFFQSSIVMF